MANATGYDTDIKTALGYVDTTTSGLVQKAVSLTAETASNKAAAIWSSYIQDGAVSAPGRVADAAYYYALEDFAEELLRLRIGNIGANPNSNVAETIVGKAMQIIESAQAGIAAFEKWVSGEMGVLGTHIVTTLDTTFTSSFDGADAATSHWTALAADGKSASIPAGSDYLKGLGFAYALQYAGANVINRKLGYSGAINPAVGKYYISAGSAMISQGSAAIKQFNDWAVAARVQHAARLTGI